MNPLLGAFIIIGAFVLGTAIATAIVQRRHPRLFAGLVGFILFAAGLFAFAIAAVL